MYRQAEHAKIGKGWIIMNQLNLLIADSAEEFCKDLASALKDYCKVEYCCTGKQALACIQNRKVDLLVLDLMIPGLDGITILEAAASQGIHPTVLAMTRIITDYVAEKTSAFGIEYLMRKPCDVLAVADRICDLGNRLSPPASPKIDIRIFIALQLNRLGIPSNLRGYKYLIECTILMYLHPDIPLTKELYPTVGQMFQSTPAQVERSMRNAINLAWDSKNEEVWEHYFSRNSDGSLPHPSNGCFFNMLINTILLHRDEISFESIIQEDAVPPSASL